MPGTWKCHPWCVPSVLGWDFGEPVGTTGQCESCFPASVWLKLTLKGFSFLSLVLGPPFMVLFVSVKLSHERDGLSLN